MDLTPEERQRIYAEEKARIEAQDRIKAEQDRVKLAYKAEQDNKSAKGCLRIFLVMAAVVIAIGAVGSLIDDKPGKVAQEAAPAKCRIVCDDTSHETVLAITKADRDAMVEASMAHDTYGLEELLLTKRIYLIPCGTTVLILDDGWSADKVRIVDGEYAGLAGWIKHGAAK
jgi:hypothetical protein